MQSLERSERGGYEVRSTEVVHSAATFSFAHFFCVGDKRNGLMDAKEKEDRREVIHYHAQVEYAQVETTGEDEFVKKAAGLLEEKIAAALTKRGHCTLGLSGGSTPRSVYAELATRPIEWTNVSIFLTDERYVAPDHDESNQKMVREMLANPVNLPPQNLVVPDTWKPLPDCVLHYDQALRGLLANDPPDVIVFGLGNDGHIASLFPPVAKEAFGEDAALHTVTDTFAIPDRITVTLPILRQADTSILLIRGEDKKKTWVKMIRSKPNPEKWPFHEILMTGRTVVVSDWPKSEA